MRRLPIIAVAWVSLFGSVAWGDYTNNIMLTGYWPPTNDMVRCFSTNEEQNPEGWIGEDWEGRGYDIHSFFPEFEDPNNPSHGYGDFMVDYQDTSADWWRITEEIHPVAIITFGWAPGTPGHNYRDWEIERKNYNRTSWSPDYLEPYQPDKVPPDDTWPPGWSRLSSLPVYEIRDAVNDAGVGPEAYVDWGGGGDFLCEYIGYHGLWYHSLHDDPSDPYWNVAAGHIHVGSNVTLEEGIAATEVTLRTLIEYVDSVVPEPSSALLLFGVVPLLGRRRG